MEEIHKKCKTAIDNQNTFFLSYIPGLNSLIIIENSLYVDDIFPKYKYMNLLQYSIASKKPKSLEFLLDYALNTCKMPLETIILPRETPARDMNLIALAIEFHSNDCLKVLTDFIDKNKGDDKKFDFDIEDQFGETPLTKALRDRNDEAVLILVNRCKADLLHQANEEKSILRPLLPILVFLLNYNSLDEIKRLWEQFDKQIANDICEKLNDMKFDENFRIVEDGSKLEAIMKKKSLFGIRAFLINLEPVIDAPIKTIKDDLKNKPSINPVGNKNISNDGSNNDDDKCCLCDNVSEEMCSKCRKFFCHSCFIDHKC